MKAFCYYLSMALVALMFIVFNVALAQLIWFILH